MSYIKGYIHVSSEKDLPVDADLETSLRLNEIKQFYPIDKDSLDVNSDLNIALRCKGKYNPGKKIFPVTKASFVLNNGSVQTKYYPGPVEKIQANIVLTETATSLKDIQLAMQPVSFEFEGQPFLLKADLKNFDDLRYVVSSKGVIDIRERFTQGVCHKRI